MSVLSFHSIRPDYCKHWYCNSVGLQYLFLKATTKCSLKNPLKLKLILHVDCVNALDCAFTQSSRQSWVVFMSNYLPPPLFSPQFPALFTQCCVTLIWRVSVESWAQINCGNTVVSADRDWALVGVFECHGVTSVNQYRIASSTLFQPGSNVIWIIRACERSLSVPRTKGWYHT